jgi:hypothetical protein
MSSSTEDHGKRCSDDMHRDARLGISISLYALRIALRLVAVSSILGYTLTMTIGARLLRQRVRETWHPPHA